MSATAVDEMNRPKLRATRSPGSHKETLVKKWIASTVLLFAATIGIQAAPMLGVEWRAPANPKTPGVQIMSVSDGSNAEELGLNKGDLVIAINGKLVKTGKEATAAVVAAKGKLSLLVKEARGGDLVVITAEIDEATMGLTAGAPVKASYKNVTRSKKK
jgi:predicted metalloprotease with PDZ domain